VIETTTGTTFLLLHALSVKGVAGEEALVEVTGLSVEDVHVEVERLLDGEFVRQRKGRIGGFALLDAGKAAHRELLVNDVDDLAVATLGGAYEAFLPLNGRFKELCTRWQLRGVDGSSEPNDHTDAEYDREVIADLAVIHAWVVSALAPAEAALSRFGRYPVRLAAALDRVQAGDIAAFTKPLTGSYHDVWMELHQDLLTSLGRDRNAGDEG
jgi:hypothetical protein